LQLAEESKLKEAIDAMFSGTKINETENRAVLHVALRNLSDKEYVADGENVMPGIHRVQEQMKAFCEKIHSGEWKGYSGKKIKYIVNIIKSQSLN
jgi:glucose-6-phosphate isomerase